MRAALQMAGIPAGERAEVLAERDEKRAEPLGSPSVFFVGANPDPSSASLDHIGYLANRLVYSRINAALDQPIASFHEAAIPGWHQRRIVPIDGIVAQRTRLPGAAAITSRWPRPIRMFLADPALVMANRT